ARCRCPTSRVRIGSRSDWEAIPPLGERSDEIACRWWTRGGCISLFQRNRATPVTTSSLLNAIRPPAIYGCLLDIGFTVAFERTSAGRIWLHAYSCRAGIGTCVVELHPYGNTAWYHDNLVLVGDGAPPSRALLHRIEHRGWR